MVVDSSDDLPLDGSAFSLPVAGYHDASHGDSESSDEPMVLAEPVSDHESDSGSDSHATATSTQAGGTAGTQAGILHLVYHPHLTGALHSRFSLCP